jgi:hypothetical protein
VRQAGRRAPGAIEDVELGAVIDGVATVGLVDPSVVDLVALGDRRDLGGGAGDPA